MKAVPLLLSFALLSFTGCDPALAEGRSGQEVFNTKCIACHQGGGNTLNPSKTLTEDSLKRDGYSDVSAIIDIVTKGKRPMPAYGIKSKKLGLDPDEIEAVSSYVLEQAKSGWKQ
ncbi:hypothetical protein GUITHDRAFT_75684 [Guillardia theta CCMP2712]|uniref:Cytochrome c domain-containing protein n=1 Tax=Guillardia theta (strain CCMP2712) TaxID=905079 RepID=L1IVV4_GUITC|nr:hypothetical protein GUITHDRAFT_75684 [Guillardia theta CCMP2712]EKX40383.1 hypothetical protein GUITHDRAFT_75684 [Guillardia theta CCMP2712]|mmetsp:Transcript_830/g.2538  ORF Transcript_830/g.2538 Transcript_830/m.2538 type:complete len:115 (-) Transcript_830:101-445(-)|eukprot:XP_005827363.1 hypothetical protein GUITHDRAFT_75684 [Guillardia theta CCMP2712]